MADGEMGRGSAGEGWVMAVLEEGKRKRRGKRKKKRNEKKERKKKKKNKKK